MQSVAYSITNSFYRNIYKFSRYRCSKGKSMVATVQPFGVVVAELFEVSHNEQLL